MQGAGYEYRDGALWVRLSGGDGPAATHADLLRALAVVLAEVAEEPDGLAPEYVASLFGLLLALIPTAEHLNQGQTHTNTSS